MSEDKNTNSTENQDKKEDRSINKWLPIGVMIGVAAGAVLSFMTDNILFLGGGAVAGLLLGTIIGSSSSDNE